MTLILVAATWGQTLQPHVRLSATRVLIRTRPPVSRAPNIFNKADNCEFVCKAVKQKKLDRIFPGLFNTQREFRRMLRQKSRTFNRKSTSDGNSCDPMTELTIYSSCCITCVSASNVTSVETLEGKTVDLMEHNGVHQFFPQARCIQNACTSPCMIDQVPHMLLVCDPNKPEEPYFTTVWVAGVCKCPNST